MSNSNETFNFRYYIVLLGNIHCKQMLLPEATLRRLLPPKVPAKLPAKLPAAPKM